MNIIEHSGIMCSCNYLYNEQMHFSNNQMIEEEEKAKFCYRCKKCVYHCENVQACIEVQKKFKQLESDMIKSKNLQIEWQKAISNFEFNIQRIRKYDLILSEKLMNKLTYLIDSGKFYNKQIKDLTLDFNIAFKQIVNMNKNQKLSQLIETKVCDKSQSLIKTQIKINSCISSLNQQFKEIFDDPKTQMDNINQSVFDESLFRKKILDIIKIRSVEIYKKLNTFHEFYHKGNELLQKGIKDEALIYFKLDIKTNPYHVKSYISTSKQLRTKKLFNKAWKCLSLMDEYMKQKLYIEINMLKQDTEYLEFLLEKSIVLQYLQEYNQALRCLEWIIKLNPAFPRAQIIKGRILIELKKYNEAIECFDLELELDPKNIEAYKFKGFTLAKCSSYVLALSCFEYILEIDERNQYAFLYKGLILCKLNDLNEAFLQFSSLLKLCSNNQKECYENGKVLFKFKIYDWAIQFYDQSIQLDANNSKYFLQKGNSLQLLNMHQEAMQCYSQAIMLDPCGEESYVRKGISLNLVQNYQEAIRCFNQAIFLNPSNAKVHFFKGKALSHQKKYSEAIKCYDVSLYLQPNFHECLHKKQIALQKLQQQIHAIQFV